MARQATGQIIEHRGKDGRMYRRLRFSAYGKRRLVSLGAVSERRAESELRHVLADVERGTWQPPQPVEPPTEQPSMPTLKAFAEEWWTLTKAQLAPNTQADYYWRMTMHLIPYFGQMPIDAITFDTVEKYNAAKLAEDHALSPTSVNKTVTLLAAILDRAVERDLIARTGVSGMAEAWRDLLSAWEGLRSEPEEYLELDNERVLVLAHFSGRGRKSGLDLAQMSDKGAGLFHVRDGKVTRHVVYLEREHAFADLGLQE
jgi:hypothetical protein